MNSLNAEAQVVMLQKLEQAGDDIRNLQSTCILPLI